MCTGTYGTPRTSYPFSQDPIISDGFIGWDRAAFSPGVANRCRSGLENSSLLSCTSPFYLNGS